MEVASRTEMSKSFQPRAIWRPEARRQSSGVDRSYSYKSGRYANRVMKRPQPPVRILPATPPQLEPGLDKKTEQHLHLPMRNGNSRSNLDPNAQAGNARFANSLQTDRLLFALGIAPTRPCRGSRTDDKNDTYLPVEGHLPVDPALYQQFESGRQPQETLSQGTCDLGMWRGNLLGVEDELSDALDTVVDSASSRSHAQNVDLSFPCGTFPV